MATYKPVRKIGVQSRSITGTRPDGNRYESALERDFMEWVEGDPDYLSYSAQPVYVDYGNPVTGRAAKYPPDGLVEWKSGRRPLLVEVKYRADCAGKWREFRAKFRAAQRLCRDRGWDFAVVTEDMIRGDFLYNIKFLSGYNDRDIDPNLRDAVLRFLSDEAKEARHVVAALKDEGISGPAVVSCIWSMVAQNYLGINRSEKVTMASLVWARGVS